MIRLNVVLAVANVDLLFMWQHERTEITSLYQQYINIKDNEFCKLPLKFQLNSCTTTSAGHLKTILHSIVTFGFTLLNLLKQFNTLL
jgi:hypothetical protein